MRTKMFWRFHLRVDNKGIQSFVHTMLSFLRLFISNTLSLMIFMKTTNEGIEKNIYQYRTQIICKMTFTLKDTFCQMMKIGCVTSNLYVIVHTSGGVYMPKLATAFYDALFPLPPDHILLNMQIQLMASLQIQIISSFVYQCYILLHGIEFYI